MTPSARWAEAPQGRRLVWVYEIVVTVVAVCVAPWAALGLLVRRDWRVGIGERLGVLPRTPPGQPAIWIHAASVGEVTALAPLVHLLHEEFPDHRLVLSTLTRTGRAVAKARLTEADACVFLPFDLRFCVTRAVDAVRPRLVLFSETELWPGFFAVLARRGIPVAMVSGRLSAPAFIRYRRWRGLFAATLVTVRWFAVQSIQTARRLVALGASAQRIVVTGSLKNARETAREDGLSLRALGVEARPVVVAGSTHDGEETVVLDGWAEVAEAAPTARLVIAPRHPERFNDVAVLLGRGGHRFVRRSELGAEGWPSDVPILLLDTVGELRGLYDGARVAFIGGTLVPVGGHNLLEAAVCGVPVLFGPHVDNVRDEAERLQASGGGIQIVDARDLAHCMRELVVDAAEAGRRGAAATAGAPASLGPLVVTMALVRSMLGSPAPPVRMGVGRP